MALLHAGLAEVTVVQNHNSQVLRLLSSRRSQAADSH